MDKPLSDKLEYAILDFVMRFTDGTHQESWDSWQNEAHRAVPESFDMADLKAAFKRLWKEGVLRLSKPDHQRRHAFEYSGKESDDEAFLFIGPFNATITDEGRRYWDRAQFRRRNGVFISHINEERAVAHVLQKYLKRAFGDDFRVFVSSDAKSIGGGKKWYTYIIDNVRLSEVVLVLVSQESKGREWINFEAGFGEGAESLVIPIAIKNMSLGQLSWPLQGLQGRSIDAIGAILDDIGNRLGITSNSIDTKAYQAELEDAEAQLVYKSLTVEPVVAGNWLRFDIQNIGNVDLELLMLEVSIPEVALSNVMFLGPNDGVDAQVRTRTHVPYKWFSCYSVRGVYGGIVPILRPIITPSMNKIELPLMIPIVRNLPNDIKQRSIFFQVHATGYRTQEEERTIADIPSWT